MTARQFRTIALGFDGAYEHAHMGHPDFRAANGRIFATLNERETGGALMLTPDQQAQLLADHPDAFAPAAGAWGRGGSTVVTLAAADAETVGEAMTLAWQHISQKPASRTSARRTPARRTPTRRARVRR